MGGGVGGVGVGGVKCFERELGSTLIYGFWCQHRMKHGMVCEWV